MTALHQNTKKSTKQAQPLFYDTKREQSFLCGFKEPLNKWPKKQGPSFNKVANSIK